MARFTRPLLSTKCQCQVALLKFCLVTHSSFGSLFLAQNQIKVGHRHRTPAAMGKTAKAEADQFVKGYKESIQPLLNDHNLCTYDRFAALNADAILEHRGLICAIAKVISLGPIANLSSIGFALM
jgi:hypothetical protein